MKRLESLVQTAGRQGRPIGTIDHGVSRGKEPLYHIIASSRYVENLTLLPTARVKSARECSWYSPRFEGCHLTLWLRRGRVASRVLHWDASIVVHILCKFLVRSLLPA